MSVHIQFPHQSPAVLGRANAFAFDENDNLILLQESTEEGVEAILVGAVRAGTWNYLKVVDD